MDAKSSTTMGTARRNNGTSSRLDHRLVYNTSGLVREQVKIPPEDSVSAAPRRCSTL
ncbi:hypothetical protein NYO67_312 [Aspergillus flavus]|nr:hypothetical protein NYO67_312 [Aspergillus flavus]